MFFNYLRLLSNNLVVNVIFEWCLLRIMVFSVRERGAENIEKKKKTYRRKTLKNEEKEK